MTSLLNLVTQISDYSRTGLKFHTKDAQGELSNYSRKKVIRRGLNAMENWLPDWFFESLPLLVWRWTSVIKRLFTK